MSNKETSEASHKQASKGSDFDLGKTVGRLSKMMQEGALSTGDLAELRRTSPENPFTPTLWRVLIDEGLQWSPDWIGQEKWERRWATLLMGMAYCNGLHDYKTPFGKALADAEWSELRFVQLLRSSDEKLEGQIRRLAQFLSSKEQKGNWAELAGLLFYQSGNAGEKVRLSLARSYYSALYAAEKEGE